MTENTKLWDLLGRTDPSHTKGFTRGGGFKGTAIKPMWSYRRMTEEFGPCGEGWGVGAPEFQVVNAGDETLVFCTASIWYTYEPGERQRVVYGVGGDKVVAKFSSGTRSDDEAFKKAYTDAITNALKLIGVGADVHMGLFDDNKYVNAMKDEFSDAPVKSSAQLKREGSWEEIKADLDADFADCHSLVALEALKATYRAKAKSLGWTQAWLNALKNEFDNMEEALKKVELAGA